MEFICADCPRKCHALRSEHEGKGVCRMGTNPVVARAALHFDEEPVLTCNGGAGAVFFSGCSLRCRFCQNYEISHKNFGKEITVQRLYQIYMELIEQGAQNIDLVNPTHFAQAIEFSLSRPLPVPVVWNSSGFERVETLRRMRGRVQVYLPDLKYVDRDLSRRYSGASHYFEYTTAALKEMLDQVGPVKLDENGAIQSGVIVRHLVLPGCIEDSKKVLRWFKRNMKGAWISLMSQYMPCGDVERVDELNRRLTQDEYDEICDTLFKLGLEDGFVQDLDSSDEKYVPIFDLTGVE